MLNLTFLSGVIHVLCESWMRLDASLQVLFPSSHCFFFVNLINVNIALQLFCCRLINKFFLTIGEPFGRRTNLALITLNQIQPSFSLYT
jgi:hypothetical protein